MTNHRPRRPQLPRSRHDIGGIRELEGICQGKDTTTTKTTNISSEGIGTPPEDLYCDAPPPPSSDVECDYYKNPTVLSRLILHQKYKSAIRRVREHPAEARIWVCRKRTPSGGPRHRRRRSHDHENQAASADHDDGREEEEEDDDDDEKDDEARSKRENCFYSLRQLPIHACCENLFRVEDSVLRSDLEELICNVVVAWQDGCSRRDHRGRLPLHGAVRNGCRPETVSILLMAAPGTTLERDHRGRTALDLHRNRWPDRGSNQEDEVGQLLVREVQFWELAREEVLYRLNHSFVPSGESIRSTSVLASSHSGNSTLISKPSSRLLLGGMPSMMELPSGGDFVNGTSRAQATRSDSLASLGPLSWSQLERRAAILEEALSDSYEKNYELGDSVSRLRSENRTLLVKYNGRLERVSCLEEENERLRERVAELERMTVCWRSHSDGGRLPKNGNAEVSKKEEESYAPWDKVDQLTAQNWDYRQRLDCYEGNTMIPEESEGSAADWSDTSTISDLSVGLFSDEGGEEFSDPHPHGRQQQAEQPPRYKQQRQQFMDSILAQAEQMGGQQLSPQTVAAWKTASVSFRSMISMSAMSVVAEEGRDGNVPQQQQRIEEERNDLLSFVDYQNHAEASDEEALRQRKERKYQKQCFLPGHVCRPCGSASNNTSNGSEIRDGSSNGQNRTPSGATGSLVTTATTATTATMATETFSPISSYADRAFEELCTDTIMCQEYEEGGLLSPTLHSMRQSNTPASPGQALSSSLSYSREIGEDDLDALFAEAAKIYGS